MAKSTETKAKKYLVGNMFNNNQIKFEDTSANEKGFDLWMTNKATNERKKIELKTTGGAYQKDRDIFNKLVFNSKEEKELFEKGETLILRIFLGNDPPIIKVFDKGILGENARLVVEDRYVVRGKIDYSKIKGLEDL